MLKKEKTKKVKKKKKTTKLATTEELQKELLRERFKHLYQRMLKSTVSALVVTAAISVLVASLVLPVLQIYGTSMEPLLSENDIAVSVRERSYHQGDIVAVYYANRLLVKRVIATEFDVVDLDHDGNFYVNGELLEEPYLTEKYYGEATDQAFPYQVPENSYFVAGDNRRESVDSRSEAVGCIEHGDVLGKIILVIWPLKAFHIL